MESGTKKTQMAARRASLLASGLGNHFAIVNIENMLRIDLNVPRDESLDADEYHL